MKITEATESACIAAFSKVTATISHEIKNALSIINENAGLLDDLVLMTPLEEGVDPQRVKKAAATIARQVSRANDIMSNVNRFAHSADHLTARESLQAICSLLITLAQRQAASKNVEMTLDCAADTSVHTYLLHLESLLYLTIRSIIERSEDGEPLRIHLGSADENRVSVSFTSASISEAALAVLAADSLESIMGLLDASFSLHGDTVVLSFRTDIDKDSG
jgi:signal transduction histidine kinase